MEHFDLLFGFGQFLRSCRHCNSNMIEFHSQGLGWQKHCLDWLLAYCTSSLSDGFCVEPGLQYGARRWSDVCRHHLLVSDTRGFMFCFACIVRV